MAQPKSWVFTQLGGDRKSLTLSGWSAPFGRPRQKAVVQDGVELRETETYYPGNDIPTRHVFGVKLQAWELTGRFRDAEPPPNGGPGYAKAKTTECKIFMRDQQQVAITWGDILAVTGLIKLFEPKREAEHEVEWRMQILIDDDSTNKPSPRFVAPQSPVDQTATISRQISTFTQRIQNQPALKPGLLESLENTVAAVNSAVAIVTGAVNKVDSFEKAVAGDIKRLRAGLGQLKTAAVNLQGTAAAANNDVYLIRRSSNYDTSWMGDRVQNEVDLRRILALMAALDKQAEIAERGKLQSSYVAQLGDSWESISMKFFGAPDKAQSIRDANGAKYGAQPYPGSTLKIPLQ